MKYEVVTTCNAQGWKEYGKRMAESFLDKWPLEAALTIYAEGFDPGLKDATVLQLPAWQSEFKKQWSFSQKANGQSYGRYNYQQDAVKFSHKVAALTDCGLTTKADVLIWLDADTFTHSKVTGEWLKGLFPEPSYIAFLDRVRSHVESGFVMYRTAHRSHARFMQAFVELYTSGDLFAYPQTDDAYLLQRLAQAFHGHGLIEDPVSLSGDARNTNHPAINGPLSACIDHMKGSRKSIGRSPKNERRTRDGHSYWA